MLRNGRDHYERKTVDELLTDARTFTGAERNEMRWFHYSSVFDESFRLEFERLFPVLRILIQFEVVQNDTGSFGNRMPCNEKSVLILDIVIAENKLMRISIIA